MLIRNMTSIKKEFKVQTTPKVLFNFEQEKLKGERLGW